MQLLITADLIGYYFGNISGNRVWCYFVRKFGIYEGGFSKYSAIKS